MGAIDIVCCLCLSDWLCNNKEQTIHKQWLRKAIYSFCILFQGEGARWQDFYVKKSHGELDWVIGYLTQVSIYVQILFHKCSVKKHDNSWISIWIFQLTLWYSSKVSMTFKIITKEHRCLYNLDWKEIVLYGARSSSGKGTQGQVRYDKYI